MVKTRTEPRQTKTVNPMPHIKKTSLKPPHISPLPQSFPLSFPPPPPPPYSVERIIETNRQVGITLLSAHLWDFKVTELKNAFFLMSRKTFKPIFTISYNHISINTLRCPARVLKHSFGKVWCAILRSLHWTLCKKYHKNCTDIYLQNWPFRIEPLNF